MHAEPCESQYEEHHNLTAIEPEQQLAAPTRDQQQHEEGDDETKKYDHSRYFIGTETTVQDQLIGGGRDRGRCRGDLVEEENAGFAVTLRIGQYGREKIETGKKRFALLY